MAIRNIKKNLDNKVIDYARRVKNSVENKFNLTNPKREDYPAMVSVCSEKSRNAKTHCACSGTPIAKYFMPTLRRLLTQQLGTISQKSTITKCENIIGQCAEVHAANKLLKKQQTYPISDIVFSVPIRPRTGEKKQYCINCQTIFNV